MIPEKILDAPEQFSPKSYFTLLVVFITLILAGAFVGASTNIINGIVSPVYFKNIMGWRGGGLPFLAILQGAIEGLIYGFLFSLIYTPSFALITRVRGSWAFAKGIFLKIIPFIYSCWAIGGVVAIFLAFACWEGYDKIIIRVPQTAGLRIGYAWVGGSIIGGMLGGVLAIPYSLVTTSREWSKSRNSYS